MPPEADKPKKDSGGEEVAAFEDEPPPLDPDILKDKDGKLFKTDSWGRVYPVDRTGTRLTAKTDRPDDMPGKVWMKLKPAAKAKAVAERRAKISEDAKAEPAAPAAPRGAGGLKVTAMPIWIR